MNRTSRLLFALSFSALLLFTSGNSSSVSAEDAPIRVEADHMSSMEKDSSVIFTGDVDARQEDVRIRSDEMTVFYTQKAKGSDEAKISQKVEKLVCNGNVEITRGEWLGTSKKMIYYSKERQFVLIGNAKAWQGQNVVSGDKIIYYLDEGRSEVVADRVGATVGKTEDKDEKKPGRVNMTILQQ
jgi:lipopolysaccharide export system protein LptA